MIRFFIKIVIVIIIASAGVIYHNTDAGREMERRIGEELRFESLEKRVKKLATKIGDFISMKGMDGLNKKSGLKEKKVVRDKTSAEQGESAPESHEKIMEDERKRLEQIIESEG